MKKRLIGAGILLIAIMIALVIRFGNSREQNAFQLSGTVEVTEVNVGFKVPGRVQRILTDEGRMVNEGEKLALLDSAEAESFVAQNSAGVQNAEAQFEKARKDLERYTALHRDGVIPAQQLDGARSAYDVADSQLRLSRASLRTAEVRFRDMLTIAPLSGVVLKKHVEEGETVAGGTTVLTIGDLTRPWVKVYLREDKLGLVKIGQRAEITVDAFPGKRYEGTVTTIASEAEFTPKNVETREERVKLVFGIKVSVKNENDELKPGMPADVKILVP